MERNSYAVVTSLKYATNVALFDDDIADVGDMIFVDTLLPQEVPTLESLCVAALKKPYPIHQKLIMYKIIHDDLDNAVPLEVREILNVQGLREHWALEIEKAFRALLTYYDEDKWVIADILGDTYYTELKTKLEERERGLKQFDKYRRGSVMEKDDSLLSAEEMQRYRNDGVLPYRVLKAGTKWPDGVVASRREEYLSEGEFERVFGMTRAAFKAIPFTDARKTLKQNKGLF
jgi:hypothetical protein